MALKKKYRINPDTLALERVDHTISYWIQRGGLAILIGILFGIGFFFLFFSIFPSPREKRVARQKESLQVQYDLLSKRVDQMQLVMYDLQQRDDNLYRVLFQAEPIPYSIRYSTLQDAAYYDSISSMTSSRLAADIIRKTDALEKSLYVQAKSYDEIVGLAKTQEIRMETSLLFSLYLTKI